jgi:hypothetical protein
MNQTELFCTLLNGMVDAMRKAASSHLAAFMEIVVMPLIVFYIKTKHKQSGSFLSRDEIRKPICDIGFLAPVEAA